MNSPREQIQIDLVNYLNENTRFNAPYGVIAGMDTLPKGGKVRTVTFGQARWLDATALIFSPNNICIKAAGPASVKLQDRYKSLTDLIADLNKF